jgi:hypothetical protein
VDAQWCAESHLLFPQVLLSTDYCLLSTPSVVTVQLLASHREIRVHKGRFVDWPILYRPGLRMLAWRSVNHQHNLMRARSDVGGGSCTVSLRLSSTIAVVSIAFIATSQFSSEEPKRPRGKGCSTARSQSSF